MARVQSIHTQKGGPPIKKWQWALLVATVLILLGGIAFGIYLKANPRFTEHWLHEDDVKALVAAELRPEPTGNANIDSFAWVMARQWLTTYGEWKCTPIREQYGDWLWKVEVPMEGHPTVTSNYYVWRKAGDVTRNEP
jgi:hypothetical protein